MDFDQILSRFFGTTDLSGLPHDKLMAGVEKLRAQFDVEEDADDRFALWCMLYMLGAAPEPEDAFDDEGDVEAAREFIETIDEDDED